MESERLSNLLKDAQLVSGSAGIQTPAVWIQSLYFQLLYSSETEDWMIGEVEFGTG